MKRQENNVIIRRRYLILSDSDKSMKCRRSERRVNRSDSVQYRMGHTNSYKTGMLKNSSANGALLWLKDSIGIGSLFEVPMMGDRDTLERVYMRVVRTEGTSPEGYTAYGCRVAMRVSETI